MTEVSSTYRSEITTTAATQTTRRLESLNHSGEGYSDAADQEDIECEELDLLL